MNESIRPTLVVAIALLLALCIFGFHFACDSSDLRSFIRETRRGEELEQFRQAVDRHFEFQKQVMRELIAQRCSLSEAMTQLKKQDREWIQELEREWPEAATDLLRKYRQVWFDADLDYQHKRMILRVEELLRGQPEETAAVLRWLEKEYQQLRASEQTSSATAPERIEKSR